MSCCPAHREYRERVRDEVSWFVARESCKLLDLSYRKGNGAI